MKLRLCGPAAIDVHETARENERERLERLYAELTSNGNVLLRMARQCNHTANEIFDQADVVDRQLKAMP